MVERGTRFVSFAVYDPDEIAQILNGLNCMVEVSPNPGSIRSQVGQKVVSWQFINRPASDAGLVVELKVG